VIAGDVVAANKDVVVVCPFWSGTPYEMTAEEATAEFGAFFEALKAGMDVDQRVLVLDLREGMTDAALAQTEKHDAIAPTWVRTPLTRAITESRERVGRIEAMTSGPGWARKPRLSAASRSLCPQCRKSRSRTRSSSSMATR